MISGRRTLPSNFSSETTSITWSQLTILTNPTASIRYFLVSKDPWTIDLHLLRKGPSLLRGWPKLLSRFRRDQNRLIIQARYSPEYIDLIRISLTVPAVLTWKDLEQPSARSSKGTGRSQKQLKRSLLLKKQLMFQFRKSLKSLLKLGSYLYLAVLGRPASRCAQKITELLK